MPTVSDCADVKLNVLSSAIEKESALDFDTDSAGTSEIDILSALTLSPTK
jgi:hypothetical protein